MGMSNQNKYYDTSSSYYSYLATCRDLSRSLGPVLNECKGNAPGEHLKDDETPVTDVDKVLGTAIVRYLKDTYGDTDYGFLQEENPKDVSRFDHRRWWLIDPLDGSRPFIKDEGDYCVMINLMERKRDKMNILVKITEKGFDTIREQYLKGIII